MASGGYDIGASIAVSPTLAVSMNDAFSLQDSGASLAQTLAPNDSIKGVGTPTGVASWLPWALVGVVVIAFMVIVFKQK